jgi:hypothetical protein
MVDQYFHSLFLHGIFLIKHRDTLHYLYSPHPKNIGLNITVTA